MQITPKEVKQAASLARLNLSREETEEMAAQLDHILAYMNKLNELDTTNIKPTSHALTINNAFREDIVCESLGQKESLINSLSQNGETFIVPKVV